MLKELFMKYLLKSGISEIKLMNIYLSSPIYSLLHIILLLVLFEKKLKRINILST
ncbi:hypothetical protein ES708_16389 [subsurface metagenome]